MKVNLKMIYSKEKEFIIQVMVVDMKANLKKVKWKEEEFILCIMVIDRKEDLKMACLKEKEYIIFMMVKGKWEIFIKENKLENMLFYQLMDMLNLNIILKYLYFGFI